VGHGEKMRQNAPTESFQRTALGPESVKPRKGSADYIAITVLHKE
jgi:hypothetical protein